MRGHWAWDVRRLTGVVGDEADCVGQRAVLGFGSQVEDGEAMGGMEKGVEAVRSRGKSETGGDGREGRVDMEEGFVCKLGELHIDDFGVVVSSFK